MTQYRTVLLLTALTFCLPTAAPAQINETLAQQFGANPNLLVTNLPPRPGTYPGSIFIFNMRFPVNSIDASDPSLRKGEPIQMIINGATLLGAKADAGLAGWLGLSSKATKAADISVSFPDARVIEMSYDNLMKQIDNSKEVVEAFKRGQNPVIVVRAYQGTPTISIKRVAGASADVSATIKNDVKVGASAVAGESESVLYKAQSPIVFAFETSQINFDPSDLEKGKLTVRLASLPTTVFVAREESFDAIFKSSSGITTAVSHPTISSAGRDLGAALGLKF